MVLEDGDLCSLFMESVHPASLDLIRAEWLHSVQCLDSIVDNRGQAVHPRPTIATGTHLTCHSLHERTSMGHGQKMWTDQAIRQWEMMIKNGWEWSMVVEFWRYCFLFPVISWVSKTQIWNFLKPHQIYMYSKVLNKASGTHKWVFRKLKTYAHKRRRKLGHVRR